MGNNGLTIGVLALQGDYERHQRQIELISAQSRQVRLPDDLSDIDALIIPGGESTTMDILIDRFNLREPLRQFGHSKAIYGTCAGMIMLASKIEDNGSGVKPLQLMDFDVLRTGYGRQLFSFDDEISADLGGPKPARFRGSFIRAPRIVRIGRTVTVLAKYNDSPVLIRQGNCLAASFHSELDNDTSLLTYFVDKFCST